MGRILELRQKIYFFVFLVDFFVRNMKSVNVVGVRNFHSFDSYFQ